MLLNLSLVVKGTITMIGFLPCWSAGSAGGHERRASGNSAHTVPVLLPWIPHEETVQEAPGPEVGEMVT